MSLFGNLFNKKKEAPAPAADPAPSIEALKAFAAGFDATEEELVALTGAEGFACARQEDSGLWLVELPITHWVFDNDPDQVYEAQEGRSPRLVILTDDRLLQVLRPRLMRNFILKATVRADREDERFLLTGLPEPGFDPDLKAILDRRMEPDAFDTDDLGEFTFNFSRHCFQSEVDFAGRPIVLSADGETKEAAAPLLDTARLLFADEEGWYGRALSLTGELALAEVQAWVAENAHLYEEAPQIPDAAALTEHLELEEIQISSDGKATCWYGDCGLLMGRTVRLTFTPGGDGQMPDAEARMEG